MVREPKDDLILPRGNLGRLHRGGDKLNSVSRGEKYIPSKKNDIVRKCLE